MRRRYYGGSDPRRASDIEELRRVAKRRLPGFVFEYLDGGAEEEETLQRNREAFREHRFVHRALVDVSERSLETSLFDKETPLPFAIGPTGFNGLLWKKGDLALARAARNAGIPMAVSTLSSEKLDNIAKEAERVWFQLYVFQDSDAMNTLIDRAERAGCEALLVGVDVPVLGNRLWDKRNYISHGKLSLRSKLDVLLYLRWLFSVFLPSGLPSFGNLDEFLPPAQRTALDGARYMSTQIRVLSWEDIARYRDRWPRKLLLKGVLADADVEQAARLGLDGVVLSNHGGRQLDGDISALEALPEIARRWGEHLTIMIDGGFRRGSHIAKALALGADLVLLGRATLYGLAAGGELGVTHALDILTRELDRVVGLLGCKQLSDLGPAVFHRSGRSRAEGQLEDVPSPEAAV